MTAALNSLKKRVRHGFDHAGRARIGAGHKIAEVFEAEQHEPGLVALRNSHRFAQRVRDNVTGAAG